MGGFGQHVRWMALLDKRFQLRDLITTADKVKYILETVYGGRTAANWINFEETYAAGLNNLIYFNHQLDKENRIVRLKTQRGMRPFTYLDDTRFLCCTCDPRIALNWYRTVKPDLNKWTNEQFLERAVIDRQLTESMPTYHANTLVINNDILCHNILDRDYYTKLVSHLQLDNNYNAAAEIHLRWWKLRRRAEENNSA